MPQGHEEMVHLGLAVAVTQFLFEQARQVAVGGKRIINPAECLVRAGIVKDLSEALSMVIVLKQHGFLQPVQIIEGDQQPLFVYQIREVPACFLCQEAERLISERRRSHLHQKLVELEGAGAAIKAEKADLDQRQNKIDDEILAILYQLDGI